MSDGSYRLVFKPLTGSFSLDKISVSAGGNGASGTVANGTLTLPGGVEFQIVNGLAINNGAEIYLAPGAEILVI
jgi:hypothetical protein